MKQFKLLFKILILLKILIINSTQNINSNENEGVFKCFPEIRENIPENIYNFKNTKTSFLFKFWQQYFTGAIILL